MVDMSDFIDKEKTTSMYLMFIIGGERYATEALNVVRIENWIELEQLPNPKGSLSLAVKIGGIMTPFLDIYSVFGINRPADSKLISLKYLEDGMVIPVDSLSEMLSARSDSIRKLPNIFSNHIASQIIQRCLALNDEIIPIISLDNIQFLD